MNMETLDDTRAMFDVSEFARRFYIGGGVFIGGVLDNNFDQELDVNGRRTGIRCVSVDVATLAVGTTITDVDAAIDYIVREKESGARTTLLIMEQG
jgi:hypothetical protein